MNFDEASYPAVPKDATNTQTNWFYPDRSFFCFDLPPRYVAGDWWDVRVESVYDLPRLPTNTFEGFYNGWSQWIDKAQKDYRFGAFSDTNAEANIYPEVHDPWMFTEYVFRGVGKGDDRDDSPEIGKGIVEPPLLNPFTLERTLRTHEGQNFVDRVELGYANDQRPTFMRREQLPVYDLEHKWFATDPDGSNRREYWESELAAQGWQDLHSDNTPNSWFDRMNIQRRVVRYGTETINSGVRIYRHPVWSWSNRWGQSQNIPNNTVNLTGPKEWFKPDGVFTGKIVPQVTIEWGIPIKDNIPNETQGGQWAIRYESYGSTASGRIGLFDRTNQISGTDGDPAAKFSYPRVPDDMTGALQVPMPRDNLVTLIWNSPKFVDDDLIHHGCQFWKGEVLPTPGNPNPPTGTARCTYYEQNVQQFGVLWEQDFHFARNDVPLPPIEVEPFNPEEEIIEALCYVTNPPTNVTSLGATIYYNRSAGGLCTSISIMKGSEPVRLFSTDPAKHLYLVEGESATITLRRYVKTKPFPHKNLCALYRGTGVEEARTEYRNAGGRCPYYSPVGKRTLGSYKAQSHNGAEWANLRRGVPSNYRQSPLDTNFGSAAMGMAGMGGISSGLFFAFAITAPTQSPFANQDISDDFQTVSVEFVPERVEVSGKERYYDTASGQPPQRDPESKVRIRAGTGRRLLDDRDTAPYGGVDSPFFGYVNQVNYRIGRNVQHCYKSQKCDPIISTPGAAPGWRRGRFSNINFVNHPLRMPGFPGYDGTDKYCHTGNSRCPFNHLDRRAAEYNENYKILIDEVLLPFRIGGVSTFADRNIVEAFLSPDGVILFETAGSETDASNPTKDAICVAVRSVAAGDPPVIGHYLPKIKDGNGVEHYVYFYYDRSSVDANHKASHVYAHIVQFDDDGQPCTYRHDNALQNGGIGYSLTPWVTAFGSEEGESYLTPWIVELYDDYREPVGYAVEVTNQLPFAGGRAPEYKDHSKMGSMIMSPWGGISNNTYIAGANGNQFGGKVSRPTIEGQQRRSYWTDADGEWILDGPKIGVGEGFVEPRARMRNRPTHMGLRIPIDGIPGNRVEDPTMAGGGFGNSDWAGTAYTYSNDTKAFLDALADVWNDYLPRDPDSDDPDAKIRIGMPSANTDFLPAERKWYRCNKCGTDFPHEEVKYLKPLQVRAGDYPLPAARLVPLASGTALNTMVPLYPVPSGEANASGVVGCPRYDGGALIFQGGYDRLMRCYSRGQVDFWGPPGTTVDRRGYFWKNPTLINRVHQDQASNKLGKYNEGNAGGYSFSTLNQTVEKMGRLPTTTAKNYQIGLSHQITAPWAAPNETIAEVAARFAPIFGFTSSDTYFLQPAGEGRLDPVTDNTVRLKVNDVLHVWRLNRFANVWDRVGIPIVACSTMPNVIAQTQIVMQDPARPVEADYGGDLRAFNEATKKWLMDVVSGSLQHYSSHSYMRVNALLDELTRRGMNPDSGKPVNPSTGQYRVIDERIIDAYGEKEDGGLKMFTLDHLKRLRNRVLPMFGYSITGGERYTAGGDFYTRVQAAYRDRFKTTQKPLPITKYATIPPQILAATERGVDYYTEWELGDFTNEKARAYYPVGATWWRIMQRVGHIRRNKGKNWFHLDDASSTNPRFPYTGDNIVSTATIFLHGTIPMDKEVVRALLVYTPDDAPSMDAIGCQGQYTGFRVGSDLYGNTVGEDREYEGHGFCYWQHYHGYTTNHEKAIPATYWGRDARFHVLAGHTEGCVTFQENGGTYTFCHYFQERNLLDDMGNPSPFSDFEQQLEVPAVPMSVPGLMDYVPSVTGGSEGYAKGTALMGLHFEDVTHGFDFTQPYLEPWSFGGVLAQKMTEHEVWKDWTYEQFERYADRYRVTAESAVNTFESMQTLEYYGSEFRGTHFPRQTQGIPNWFNYDGYDTAGRFSTILNIEKREEDNKWATGTQVLVQAATNTIPVGSSTASGSNSQQIEGGGNGSQQAGNVPKVLDITKTVTRLYNERVDRYYSCTLGKAYSELFDHVRGKTDTNLGQVSRFHQGTYDPNYEWNYRFLARFGSFNAGMWLTDPWHHPTIVGDRPIVPNGNGDPVGQSEEDRKLRVSGESDADDGYGAFNLCHSNMDDAIADGAQPYPDSDEMKYWRVTDDRYDDQYFEMDLRQVPYETERRPWRYEPGHTDSSSALCPNINCYVHQSGWSVAQFYAQATTTWGMGVIPSLTSKNCAMCGTELVGWTTVGSDGITTVAYDDPDKDDALINAFEISVEHPSWNPEIRHGFSVEYYNSLLGQWRELFTVSFNEVTLKYEYLEWAATGWVSRSTASLPSVFKGSEGLNGVPKTVGAHFVAVTGMKVRFVVPQPAIKRTYYPGQGGYATSLLSSSKPESGYFDLPKSALSDLYAAGKFGERPENIAITLRVGDTNENDTPIAVKSVYEVEPGVVRFNLFAPFSVAFDRVNIEFRQYLSRCTKFRVYGFPWRAGELVITDPGYLQPSHITVGNTSFRLNNWPSQIYDVRCRVGDARYVRMGEDEVGPRLSNGSENQNFEWEVIKDEFNGQTYLRIVGGKWYYDFSTNNIVVPSHYRDPDSGERTSIWSLNADLYADDNIPFPVQTIPSYITVEYLVGIGMPVEVEVTSCGDGPSYQLEPECIQFVCSPTGNGTRDGYTPPNGFTTTALPAIGQSVRLKNLGGEKMQMLWHCYNHKPIFWKGEISWLVGDELLNTGQGGAWGDNDVWNLLTGKLGTNLADLRLRAANGNLMGDASPIRGKAGGKVTLYGAANAILSGELLVMARAYTNRSYSLPDGKKVEMYERTGGMKTGFFTWRLMVKDSVNNRRTGITAAIPRVLVYLRERKLTDPISKT